jgi:prepilin-type N-terminal cleavage/methylation domain-containing protein/prepilin-type processing-associated H-X9-DG protein
MDTPRSAGEAARILNRKGIRRMKKGGFTLIELLVVIAIIAILMAILMPALRLARDEGRRILCVSNVRNLTMAYFLYQDENDNVLVNGNVPRSSQFKESHEVYWVEPPQGVTGSYTGDTNPTLEDELRGIRQGGLYPYLKTVNVYRCTADNRKREPGKATFRSFSIAGGMNGEERNSYTQRAIKKYTEIRNPATKYVFVEEADPRQWNMGSWIIYPTGDSWADPLSIWHNKRSTLGWADGHAEIHRWLDERTIEMSERGQFGAVHPDNPDLKFMQAGYQLKPAP